MVTFEIKDMTCGHCVSSITKAVRSVDEDARVRIDLARHRVQIEPTRTDAGGLARAIREAGYTPVEVSGAAADSVVAFDRGGVVTVATRLPVGLSRHGGWHDTALSLDGHTWTEVFTNTGYGGNRLSVAELLHSYPVALLVKEQ